MPAARAGAQSSRASAPRSAPGRERRPASAVLVGLLSGACGPAPSTLAPHGPGAARLADLSWLLFGVAAVVFVIVIGVTLYAVFRRPADRSDDEDNRLGSRLLVPVGGIIVPLVVLPTMFVITLQSMADLSAPPTRPELTVQVIGHQWWWEVRYPDQGFTTANELHVPAGQPVSLEVTTEDVIHSFWVPQLQHKIDLIPGKVNSIWLQADQPGVYRGQCAEYCGVQHANMAFLVIAEPPGQFADWLNSQQQPAVEPTDPVALQGAQAFSRLGCIACHAIRYGTMSIGGRLGPDLTHFGSRRTIAAGTVPNTRGYLGGWIADPQNIKPGNKMPALNVDPDSLRALIAYLESLQ